MNNILLLTFNGTTALYIIQPSYLSRSDPVGVDRKVGFIGPETISRTIAASENMRWVSLNVLANIVPILELDILRILSFDDRIVFQKRNSENN
jgi:hypothetical protein